METTSLLRKAGSVGAAAVALVLGLTSQGIAHCDTMNGPVVEAGRQAIRHNDVRLALVWVKPADESEVRNAFEQTMAVRRSGEAARELADRWFFETLVRVHRAGEGAPYTGLKDAGAGSEPGIAAAEEALHKGSPDELTNRLVAALRARVHDAYNRVRHTENYRPEDIEAGRQHVEAYVRFIHAVEAIVTAIAPNQEAHGTPVEHQHH